VYFLIPRRMARPRPDTAPPDPSPLVAAPDPIEQLTRLAALKDQGVLTEEEFAAQQAKILEAQ
jgi:hypothetical protein